MGNHKRYVSVRLYPSDNPKVAEGVETPNDVCYSQMDVGNNSLVFRSRREQHYDSGLLVLRSSSCDYFNLLYQTTGVAVLISAVWLNVGNWKANVLFGLAVFFLLMKIWKLLQPIIKKHMEE